MAAIFYVTFLLFAFCNANADEEALQGTVGQCQDHEPASEWCRYLLGTTSERRGCNGFLRSVSSSSSQHTIVFKLLENLWHNCPKTCFNCDLHKNPRVPASLISDSEKYLNNRIIDPTLIGKVHAHSPTVDVDRWLEVNAVLEHMFVCENAEDAAQDEFFDQDVNSTICEKWRDELKTTEFVAVEETLVDGTVRKRCADVIQPANTDIIAAYNLPPNLKDGMHWWCRETCLLCPKQKDIVSHTFFSF